jgi:hypothetical protein
MANEVLDPTFIRIYPDSSGIENMIGAVAVQYHHINGNQTVKHVIHYCLGSETKHTVYEGKVTGEILTQHPSTMKSIPDSVRGRVLFLKIGHSP